MSIFPSLDLEIVAKMVGREYISSKLKIDNVDYLELGKYIPMNWNPTQIRLAGLQKVVP